MHGLYVYLRNQQQTTLLDQSTKSTCPFAK